VVPGKAEEEMMAFANQAARSRDTRSGAIIPGLRSADKKEINSALWKCKLSEN